MNSVAAPWWLLRRKTAADTAAEAAAREGEETQVLISPSHCDSSHYLLVVSV